MTSRHLSVLLTLTLALSLVNATPAGAQVRPKTTVAGGYSFLRDLGTTGTAATNYPSGAFATVTRQLGLERLSVVGDIGMNSRENRAIEVVRLRSFLLGGRFDVLSIWRARVFGQALVGLERFSEPGFSESGTAFEPGAGIDISLWRRLGVRAATDYRIVRSEGTTFKSIRVNIGTVLAF